MSKAVFLLWRRSTSEVPILSSHCNPLVDTVALAVSKGNEVAWSDKFKLVNDKILLNNVICNPDNCIIFLECDTHLNSILWYKKFNVVNFSTNWDHNKLLLFNILKHNSILIPDFTLNEPFDVYPFVKRYLSTDSAILVKKDSTSSKAFETNILYQKLIHKKLQCDYKVYMFLHKPIGILLRFRADETEGFDNLKDDDTIWLPIYPILPLHQIMIPTKHDFYWDPKDTKFAKLSNKELTILAKVLTQEKIELDANGACVIPKNIVFLATKVSRLLRIGMGSITIMNSEFGVPNVIGVDKSTNFRGIAPRLGYSKLAELCYPILERELKGDK